jgi:hypothetical protein
MAVTRCKLCVACRNRKGDVCETWSQVEVLAYEGQLAGGSGAFAKRQQVAQRKEGASPQGKFVRCKECETCLERQGRPCLNWRAVRYEPAGQLIPASAIERTRTQNNSAQSAIAAMVMMAAPDPVQSMLAMDESRLKATIAEGAARRSLGETMAATTAATTAETTAVTTPASVSPAQAEAPMQIDPASITTTTTTTTTTSSSTTSATTTSTSSPPPPPQRSVAIAAKGAKVDDSDYGAFIKGHVHEREAFGDTIKRVGSDELASMSVEERQAFNWHQANLEMSCGINLDNIGREWNEDEPYVRAKRA